MRFELAPFFVTPPKSENRAPIGILMVITKEILTLPLQKNIFSERKFHEESTNAITNEVG